MSTVQRFLIFSIWTCTSFKYKCVCTARTFSDKMTDVSVSSDQKKDVPQNDKNAALWNDLLVQKYIKLILTLSPKDPFANDDEYLRILEAIFHLHFVIFDTSSVLSTGLLSYVCFFINFCILARIDQHNLCNFSLCPFFFWFLFFNILSTSYTYIEVK